MAARLLSSLQRYPLTSFFGLAYLLSWYPWLLSIARHSGNGGPNPYGPLLAALIVGAATGGKPEVRALLRRVGRWRVGVEWYQWRSSRRRP